MEGVEEGGGRKGVATTCVRKKISDMTISVFVLMTYLSFSLVVFWCFFSIITKQIGLYSADIVVYIHFKQKNPVS